MEVHVGGNGDVTIGRIVRYTLTANDAQKVNRRRTHPGSILERIERAVWPLGAQAHIGTVVGVRDVFPMMVVQVWTLRDSMTVNGQVFLDGNDVLWVTGVAQGDAEGQWQWPGVPMTAPGPVAAADVPEPAAASGG